MADFFFRRKETQDERLAKEASGDMNLIESPRDGKLVAVAEQDGVGVCGYCLQPFSEDKQSPKHAVEYTPQGASERGENWGTRLLLHAGCVNKAVRRGGNLVNDRVRGHQVRRFLTKALKPFAGKGAKS